MSLTRLLSLLVGAPHTYYNQGEVHAYWQLPRQMVVEYHRLRTIAIVSDQLGEANETDEETVWKTTDKYFRNTIVPLWLKLENEYYTWEPATNVQNN